MQGKLTVDNEEVKEVEEVREVMKQCGSASVEEGFGHLDTGIGERRPQETRHENPRSSCGSS